MGDVCLIPLGVGEAFTARHYTTCLALGAGDDWLLLDCPHPIRKMLREASTAAGRPFDLDRVRGVAVSHLAAALRCWPTPTSRPGSGTACSPPAWNKRPPCPAARPTSAGLTTTSRWFP
jgi:hypothetical protein